MSTKRYWKYGFGLCLILLPIALQIVMGIVVVWVIPAIENGVVQLLVMSLCVFLLLFAIWNGMARKNNFPEDGFVLYMPIAAAFFYYMLIFMIPLWLEHYAPNGEQLVQLQIWGGILWVPIQIVFQFSGSGKYIPLVFMVVYPLSALLFCVNRARHGRVTVYGRKAVLLLSSAVVLCGIYGGQLYDRSQKVLTRDNQVVKVEDEVDLYDYMPFLPGNRLVKWSGTPTLRIDDAYPRLDGATAAYPVYGAMAQAIYSGLDKTTVSEYVSCSTTGPAYERLINGEIDLFFGVQPSKEQIALAKSKGVTFYQFPIGKEAFVFFVNGENPVESLTVAQIQDIYQKKIRNWKSLGGSDEAILAFQRPKNSGSQTIMERMMGNKRLPAPLREEYAVGMGGVINEVATYRNYHGAIGYSFRYFATDMKVNERIRLLAVDGIAPTVENIQNGTYPFTVEVYAVTTKEPERNVKLLLDWILSAEGQQMVENCGYVKGN